MPLLWVTLALLNYQCLAISVVERISPGESPLPPSDPGYEGTLQLQYLGVGGYVLRRGAHAVVTAPLYSNPGWLRVGLWRISPDTSVIDQLHPSMAPADVEAILVGHAHYDHLMDVPYIARKYHPQATIYGNRSTERLVMVADPGLSNRVKALDEEVARNSQPGRWFYVADSTIRIMALESDHGPHALGIHIMKGEVKDNLKRLPRSAWNWKEGETLAYLIDFLGQGDDIDFRVYYQDATAPDSAGFLPHFPPEDDHHIDIAILCAGSAQALKEYPTTFLRAYQPRNVILGHWEHFFRSPLKPPRRLRFTNIEQFIREVEAAAPGAKWLLPMPMGVYSFSPVE